MKGLLKVDYRNKPWNLCKNVFGNTALEKVRVIFEEVYKEIKKNTIFSNIPFDNFPDHILCEYWFEEKTHFELGVKERAYYIIKKLIPYKLRRILRNRYSKKQINTCKIKWPYEERYITFLHTLLEEVEKRTGLTILPLDFWPKDYDCSFVITHDVEGPEGLKNAPMVMELEEKYGFRSMFNFVPYRYKVDEMLITYLRERGFDVGLHGLKHDGKLFWSERVYRRRVKKMNEYIDNYGLKGFRAPLTHRNPEWLQLLNISFDMSFFDTDPFEPIPGGTMSIYPFFMGNFVELPYTLPQDCLLFNVLGYKDISLWKEKANFIERWKGMILINVHPDYISKSNEWGENKYPVALYEEFLSFMKNKRCWASLPIEVADWWRRMIEKIE